MDYKKFGSVIVGEKGKLFFDRFRDTWFVKPSHALAEVKDWPEESVPRARDNNNYAEWLDAIEGKVARGQSDFSYAGPFTETILLGCVAQKNPGAVLKWKRDAMSFEGRPDLDAMVKRSYRNGWEIEV